MNKQQILNCLGAIYQRTFDNNDMRLSLEVMQEIIKVSQMKNI